MTDNSTQPDPQNSSPPVPAKLPFLDKFFSSLGGCTVAFAVAVLPMLTLLVGIMGLIACRDSKARQRATWFTIGSAIWFGICLLIIFAGLSSGHR